MSPTEGGLLDLIVEPSETDPRTILLLGIGMQEDDPELLEREVYPMNHHDVKALHAALHDWLAQREG